MNIGLFTWGSEGDVRPFVALAAELAARGHHVELSYVLINGSDLDPLCASLGVQGRGVARREMADALARPGPHHDALHGGQSPLKQVQSVLAGLLDPVTPQMLEDARAHMERYDLAVVHLLHHPAAAVAAARGIPVVQVLTAPTLPTRDMPPIGAPNLGPFNRWLWRLAEAIGASWFLPRVNASRAAVGLAPVRRMYPDPPNPEVALALTCVSPALFARPKDWAENQHVSGFFDLPAQALAMPAEVETFLAAKDAPILMSFGSMLARPSAETDECLAMMFTAAERVGRRAIIQVPEHARARFTSSAERLVATALPHALVMPRCALVVHHGGAGTTQAACLAGVPSVVVPFMADQFFWAARLRVLGTSGAPVKRSALTAERLAKAIALGVNEPGQRDAAARVGALLRRENGVLDAATRIEAVNRGCTTRLAVP